MKRKKTNICVKKRLSQGSRLRMAESNGPNNEHLSNGVEENGPKSASQMSEDELKAQVEALKPELIKHARKSLMKGDTW